VPVGLAELTSAESVNPLFAVLFYGFASITVISAWAIVFTGNIVRMAIYLLITLCGVAAAYFMLAAEFLAVIQLIVYAGGTLVLIIFGVMLTGRDAFPASANRSRDLIIGVGVAGMIAWLLLMAIRLTSLATDGAQPLDAQANTVKAIGRAMLTTYLLPFEIMAVLLLVVMIAAAYMARRRTRPLT